MHDVIIVGAGPAGATLAYELAKKGIGALLLEGEKLPRYKCCAGSVTGKTARLLGFDISEVSEDIIHEISFTFNLGSPYVGQHSQPLMYAVTRDVFDYFLVKRAQQVGAMLMDGEKVTQVSVRDDWVEISTADNVCHSRLVVGADGAYGTVARELGMARSMEYFTGIESEITVSVEELAKWKSRAQIDLGCIPGGYAWVFPKRDHLSVGAGCPTSKARDLRARYQRFLDSLNIGSHAITSSGSHLIPTCTKGRFVWRNRALLLGDAAGFCDPLTGEGIYYAILGAQLAAPVIEGSLARSNIELENYQHVVESEVMPELRIARTLSRLFVRFPHLAFRMLDRSGGLWKALCGLMLGEMDYVAVRERAGGFRGIFEQLLRP